MTDEPKINPEAISEAETEAIAKAEAIKALISDKDSFKAILESMASDEVASILESVNETGKVNASYARGIFKQPKPKDVFTRPFGKIVKAIRDVVSDEKLWTDIPAWRAIKLTFVVDNYNGKPQLMMSSLNQYEAEASKAGAFCFMDKDGETWLSRVQFLHDKMKARVRTDLAYHETDNIDEGNMLWTVKAEAEAETETIALSRVNIARLIDIKANSKDISEAISVYRANVSALDEDKAKAILETKAIASFLAKAEAKVKTLQGLEAEAKAEAS